MMIQSILMMQMLTEWMMVDNIKSVNNDGSDDELVNNDSNDDSDDDSVNNDDSDVDWVNDDR